MKSMVNFLTRKMGLPRKVFTVHIPWDGSHWSLLSHTCHLLMATLPWNYSLSPKVPHKPKEATLRGHCLSQLQQEALNKTKKETTSSHFPVEQRAPRHMNPQN